MPYNYAMFGHKNTPTPVTVGQSVVAAVAQWLLNGRNSERVCSSLGGSLLVVIKLGRRHRVASRAASVATSSSLSLSLSPLSSILKPLPNLAQAQAR